ncbi:MAG: phage tail tape measure protein [Allorhizobium sp.]
MDDDTMAVSVDLDAAAALRVLDDLEARSQSFGHTLSGALKNATVGGKSLEDTLRSLGNRLADLALSSALKPLDTLLSGLVSGLSGSLGSALGFAQGGVPGRVTPFAEGGVVSAPTYFSLANGTGLAGEAGAEAILPLKRGSDGSLGVSGAVGGTQITFNVTATDAASFRRSEGQISAMLARGVARGQRNL